MAKQHKFDSIPKNLIDEFTNVFLAMEPENLTCDGELSRTQVRKRMQTLRKHWTVLENNAGMKVDQNEFMNYIWDF